MENEHDIIVAQRLSTVCESEKIDILSMVLNSTKTTQGKKMILDSQPLTYFKRYPRASAVFRQLIVVHELDAIDKLDKTNYLTDKRNQIMLLSAFANKVGITLEERYNNQERGYTQYRAFYNRITQGIFDMKNTIDQSGALESPTRGLSRAFSQSMLLLPGIQQFIIHGELIDKKITRAVREEDNRAIRSVRAEMKAIFFHVKDLDA